jgi:hypothetical protein
MITLSFSVAVCVGMPDTVIRVVSDCSLEFLDLTSSSQLVMATSILVPDQGGYSVTLRRLMWCSFPSDYITLILALLISACCNLVYYLLSRSLTGFCLFISL